LRSEKAKTAYLSDRVSVLEEKIKQFTELEDKINKLEKLLK
jgi:hypothetical protein